MVDTTTIPSKVVEEPASGPYYLKNWSGALATTFIALQNENKPVPKVIGVVESGKLDVGTSLSSYRHWQMLIPFPC